jgi:inorganic pyrophosphatase
MKERLQGLQIQEADSGADQHRLVEVVIEIPRWSFLKRGSRGTLDFVSPFPCPFNYGSVPGWLGGEGDLLDAIVLGPRLAAGQRVRVPARAAIGLAERYMYDDKLVCSQRKLTPGDRWRVLRFMMFYARCKRVLNCLRGAAGPTYCTGWEPLSEALARAKPAPADWECSSVHF